MKIGSYVRIYVHQKVYCEGGYIWYESPECCGMWYTQGFLQDIQTDGVVITNTINMYLKLEEIASISVEPQK